MDKHGEPTAHSFRSALIQAMTAARMQGDLAQAVVSSRDGAYLVTPLASIKGKQPYGVVLDGRYLPKDVTGVQAKRLDEDVLAVVGRDTVFNFTKGELPSIDITGPAAFKGELLGSLKMNESSAYKGETIEVTPLGDALLIGSSRREALEKATLAARDGLHPTQAVLKDTNGDYYISRVATADGGNPFIRLRDVESAKGLSSALVMLVGTNKYLDFSGAEATSFNNPQEAQS